MERYREVAGINHLAKKLDFLEAKYKEEHGSIANDVRNFETLYQLSNRGKDINDVQLKHFREKLALFTTDAEIEKMNADKEYKKKCF